MTSDERELLVLNTNMVVALLREQYTANVMAISNDPKIKNRMENINTVLLEHMSKMMALQARVNAPESGLAMADLTEFFKNQLLLNVKKELGEVQELDEKKDKITYR